MFELSPVMVVVLVVVPVILDELVVNVVQLVVPAQ